MSDSGSYAVLGTVYAASSMAHLACKGGLIVVIATVVRRHRPDASGAALLWAITSVATGIFFWALSTVGPLLITRTSADGSSFIMFQELMSLLGTVVEVGLTMLLARALIRLAEPPKPVVVEGDAPYR